MSASSCSGPGTVALDRTDPEREIASAGKRCSNWGRWGEDDVLGTMNFLDERKRREGAALVRRGTSFSLSQRFESDGPQKGWRRRTNPVHSMLDTGTDAEAGVQGLSERRTFSFSSRIASACELMGGSIAIAQSSCNAWFCTMSRSVPVLS